MSSDIKGELLGEELGGTQKIPLALATALFNIPLRHTPREALLQGEGQDVSDIADQLATVKQGATNMALTTLAALKAIELAQEAIPDNIYEETLSVSPMWSEKLRRCSDVVLDWLAEHRDERGFLESVSARNRALLSLDLDKIKAFVQRYGTREEHRVLAEAPSVVFWGTIHAARMLLPSLPPGEKEKSREWLEQNLNVLLQELGEYERKIGMN